MNECGSICSDHLYSDVCGDDSSDDDDERYAPTVRKSWFFRYCGTFARRWITESMALNCLFYSHLPR